MIRALLIIDMLKDFVYDTFYSHEDIEELNPIKGKLCVPYAEDIRRSCDWEVIKFQRPTSDDIIVFVEDEHTADSEEIKSGEYPPHCIRGTTGAERVLGAIVDNKRVFCVKKDEPNGFSNPRLAEILREHNVDEIFIIGLVREICIIATIGGARSAGIKNIKIVYDATIGLDYLNGIRALNFLARTGVKFVHSADIGNVIETVGNVDTVPLKEGDKEGE